MSDARRVRSRGTLHVAVGTVRHTTVWSPSYSKTSCRRTWRAICRPTIKTVFIYRRHLMNTIIYIVGLVVVVGLVLSFFGLR